MIFKDKPLIFLPAIIALLTIIFASNLIFNNYFITSLDNKLIDYHFDRRGSIFSEENSKVIILGISNETLKELPSPYNQWPLARNLFAKVIKNLNQAGVKVIGIDILFNEEDRYNRFNDSLFLNEINRFNNVVLAAKLNEVDARYISLNKEMKNYNNIFYKGDDKLIGFVNVIPDFDGVIRRYYPNYFDLNTDRNLPTFSLSVYAKYLSVESKKDYSHIKPQKKSFLINYYGPSNTFTTIELIDVLDDIELRTKLEIETGEEINTWDDSISGLKHSGIFKDKIVLIGSIEPEDKDIYPVAISSDDKMQYGNLMYGVEIHANVVQMLIDNNNIHIVHWSVLIILVLLFAYLSDFLFRIHKKIKISSLAVSEIFNLILLLIMLYVVYEISFQLFTKNYFLSTISISLAAISVYLSNLIVHYLSERKQKMMIKNMFSHYVSSKIVDDLIENPQKLKLGGERKELSILFSDITNFTTLSESIEPEILVDFMNDYFDKMTEIIFKYNGTLDKFEGDAVMAFWGAPLNDPNHTSHSIEAALEMRLETKKLSEKWKNTLNFDIFTRIGINTGEVIVGNMGSNKKFDFTVMGDNVNIAARLEAINKFYGTDIIVSEKTIQNNKEKYLTRELDYLLVKGKSKPIKIYQLIYAVDEVSEIDWKFIITEFEEGIRLYREKNFAKSLERFEKIISLYKNDKPSLLYIKRCEEYLKNPPKDDWQGISEVLMK